MSYDKSTVPTFLDHSSWDPPSHDPITSLYLHFPFCGHLCNYCDFYKTQWSGDDKAFQDYHQYLGESWNYHQEFLRRNSFAFGPLETLYMGGGTPSLWGKAGADFFQNFLKQRNLTLTPDCEFTLEVNPGGHSWDGLLSWEDIGVNRFSLGVQSIEPRFLELLDRKQDVQDVWKALKFFAEKKWNYSVDLMLGLPDSEIKKRDVIAELEELLNFGPSHFSVYILTPKAGYPLKARLPREEWIRDEYLRVAEFLKTKGFEHYEVSNFALLGKESRHNLKYWSADSVAALGKSATGFLRRNSESGVRYKWKTTQVDWELELLKAPEMLLEKLYLSLRTNGKLDLCSFFPKDYAHDVLTKIQAGWRNQGYVDAEDRVTSLGHLMTDELMNDLFRHQKELQF